MTERQYIRARRQHLRQWRDSIDQLCKAAGDVECESGALWLPSFISGLLDLPSESLAGLSVFQKKIRQQSACISLSSKAPKGRRYSGIYRRRNHRLWFAWGRRHGIESQTPEEEIEERSCRLKINALEHMLVTSFPDPSPAGLQGEYRHDTSLCFHANLPEVIAQPMPIRRLLGHNLCNLWNLGDYASDCEKEDQWLWQDNHGRRVQLTGEYVWDTHCCWLLWTLLDTEYLDMAMLACMPTVEVFTNHEVRSEIQLESWPDFDKYDAWLTERFLQTVAHYNANEIHESACWHIRQAQRVEAAAQLMLNSENLAPNLGHRDRNMIKEIGRMARNRMRHFCKSHLALERYLSEPVEIPPCPDEISTRLIQITEERRQQIDALGAQCQANLDVIRAGSPCSIAPAINLTVTQKASPSLVSRDLNGYGFELTWDGQGRLSDVFKVGEIPLLEDIEYRLYWETSMQMNWHELPERNEGTRWEKRS